MADSPGLNSPSNFADEPSPASGLNSPSNFGEQAVPKSGFNSPTSFEEVTLLGGITSLIASATISAGKKRLLVGRKDGTVYIKVDGVTVASATDTSTFDNTTKLEIGGGNNNPFDGKLSGIRLKHKYLEPSWNQPVPLPSNPYINDVTLLIPTIGINAATTFPELKGRAITANGNAQISTAQSRYNGSSGLLDGTGDYLSTAIISDDDFGAGSATVEGYWRFTNLSGSPQNYLFAFGTQWSIYVTSAGSLVLFDGGSIAASINSIITTSTWYHIAVVKNAANAILFVNGINVAMGTWVTATTPTGNLTIGGRTSDGYVNGSFQWVRITKQARYTESFPVPTQPFPLI